jgi:hypothetical protein
MTNESKITNNVPKNFRHKIGYSILRILRANNDPIEQETIEIAIAREFALNRLNPVVKAKIAQEVNFSLSRLVALRLIVDRLGDAFSRLTSEGRVVSEGRYIELVKDLEQKERTTRSQS